MSGKGKKKFNLSGKKRKDLHELLEKIMISVCDISLPGSSYRLYPSFREEKFKNALLLGAVINGIRAAKKGRTEGKTFRALLCSSFPIYDERLLLHGLSYSDSDAEAERQGREVNMQTEFSPDIQSNVDGIQKPVGISPVLDVGVVNHSESGLSRIFPTRGKYNCHVISCVIDRDEDVGTATSHNGKACRAPVHLLCCQRVLKLVVNDSFDSLYCSRCYQGLVQMQSACAKSAEDILSLSTFPDKKHCPNERQVAKEKPNGGVNDTKDVDRIRRSGALGRMYQASRKNWYLLLCNGVVLTKKRSKKRLQDNDIRDALRFIINPQNVQLLSWGSKRVRVDQKWVNIPVLKQIYRMEQHNMQICVLSKHYSWTRSSATI